MGNQINLTNNRDIQKTVQVKSSPNYRVYGNLRVSPNRPGGISNLGG